MSVMVGGFGLCGNAEALIAAVPTLGVTGLTLISNNAGSLGKGLATWLQAGIVAKVICSYIGNNEDLHKAMARGDVEVQMTPQGTLVIGATPGEDRGHCASECQRNRQAGNRGPPP